MSGLENMRTRMNYIGGKRQVDRMNEDKLRTLKKALLYSYQSATAILADGREFRCLINPDMLKNQYDDKIISIPFRDVCLGRMEKVIDEENHIEKWIETIPQPIGTTTEGIETIGLSAGDVFTWKENGSDWLVFLQRLEETAYFRAEIRRCRYEVEVNDNKYKCYAAKTSNTEIDWRHQQEKLWNDLDYSLQMYVTKNAETEAFFHRFTVVKVNGKPWEVQAVDNMSTDGIITLALKEWYSNSVQEAKDKEDKEKPLPPEPSEDEPSIDGDVIVYPYEKKTYTIRNAENGKWVIGSTKAKILQQTTELVTIEIVSGRSGNFELKYEREDEEDIVLKVTIKSL